MNNPLDRFANSTAFARTHLLAFRTKLKSCQSNGKVSTLRMKANFTTEIWQDALNSYLPRILDTLKFTGASNHKYEYEQLLLLGILWCQGDDYLRAETILTLMSHESQRYGKIMKQDPDLVRLFDRILTLASTFTILNAQTTNQDIFMPNESKLVKLVVQVQKNELK